MANVLGKLTSRTWPWMTAATILVAGFMYWLYAESSTIESSLAVADTVETLPRIADTTFVQDPTRFSRQRILLSPLLVSGQVGRATLTVDLPGMPDYPLILERSIVESAVTIVPGDLLSVAGQVYALNDSLLNIYAQRGLLDPEGRAKFEGQPTFFLVDSLDFIFPGEEIAPEGSGR
jgi:hypothetical protein